MDLYGIVYTRWSFWRDWPKNQRRLLMRPVQNRKSISIHFKDEELELLKEFEEYRKKNYFTRSGWVKQHMQRELHQQKQHCFRWNEKCKNLRRPLHDAFGLRKEMENEYSGLTWRGHSGKLQHQKEEVTWKACTHDSNNARRRILAPSMLVGWDAKLYSIEIIIKLFCLNFWLLPVSPLT